MTFLEIFDTYLIIFDINSQNFVNNLSKFININQILIYQISCQLLIIYVKLFDRIFALGSKCAVLGVFCLVVYALLLITIPPFIQVII